jgi:glycosyltransferase involved in cell wall biosynthesis
MARSAFEISNHLVERGHEVTVYTTNQSLYKTNLETNKPVYLEGMKVYYFENLRKYFTKKNFLPPPIPYYLPFIARREVKQFDIIHIHGHRTILAVIVHHYAKKYGIPYVLQARGSVLPFFQKQKLKKIFDLLFGYRILKDASKVLALTKTEVEQYKKMGMDENKNEIIPNGIDLSEYDNLPKREEFRKKYSISDDEKIILYLGRIHKIKGIDLLVEAFSDSIKELDEVRLVIVGPDDGFLSTLKRQIEDLKIGDKILFTGPLYGRDKLRAYIDADVYVLPSVYEAFPNTVLEACACGRAVVVTDRCGIADVVDGVVGRVVEYDKNQLRDAIFEILNDDELRIRFEEETKKLVREYFSWADIVKKVEEVYETAQAK